MLHLLQRATMRTLVFLSVLVPVGAMAQFGVPAPVTPAIPCPAFTGFPLTLNLGAISLSGTDGIANRCAFQTTQAAINSLATQAGTFAPSASPTFTGTASIPVLALTSTGSTGDVSAMRAVPSTTAANGTLANLLLSSTARVVPVEAFYQTADAGDWAPAFNRAIAYVGAAGGGTVNAMASTQYNIATTVTLNYSLVKLHGAATGGLHDVGDLVTGGTKLKWTGADGGTMVRIAAPTGSQQGLLGYEFTGFALISGDYPYSTAAGRGVEVISAQFGIIRVATSEFKNAGVYMYHDTTLGESFDTAYNEIYLSARQLNTSGTGLVLDGDNINDVYYNQFRQLKFYYNNGDAIDVKVADSNIFHWTLAQKAGTGPGRPLVLRGGTTAAHTARANRFNYFTQNITAGTITSEGTDTSGVTVPALDNVIEVFDNENATPSFAIGTGSNLRYGLQKMPPGILSTNLTQYGGYRVLTDGSAEMWGVTSSLTANTLATINLPLTLKDPVYNVSPTLEGAAAGSAGVTNRTTTSFQIYPSTAGIWNWRAVGRLQ